MFIKIPLKEIKYKHPNEWLFLYNLLRSGNSVYRDFDLKKLVFGYDFGIEIHSKFFSKKVFKTFSCFKEFIFRCVVTRIVIKSPKDRIIVSFPISSCFLPKKIKDFYTTYAKGQFKTLGK